MLVDAPATRIEAEIVDHGHRREVEGPVAFADRDIDAGIAEADDVGAAVASHVGKKARMLVDAPATRIEAEIVDHGHRREVEGPVAFAERDIDAGIAETDDVDAASTSHVGKKPRMLVDAPAARIEAKVVDHRHGGEIERAVAVAECDVHAVVAEADDVRKPIAGDVNHEARMPVDSPALVMTEVGDDRLRLEGERPVAVAQRNVDPRIAEADDVRAAIAAKIGKKARVLLHAPSTRFVTEVGEHELRIGERPVELAQSRPYAVVAETHNIRTLIAGDVGEQARVLIDAPAARSVPVGALLDVANAAGAQQNGQIVRKRDGVVAEVAKKANENVVAGLLGILARHVEYDRTKAAQAEPAARVPQRASLAQRRTGDHVTHIAAGLNVGKTAWVRFIQR